MKKVVKDYIIDSHVKSVWHALVNPTTIEKWGGGPVKMQASVDFKFKLWGGEVHGKNLRVVKERMLEQEWYGGNWKNPSRLKFELSEKDGKTHLHMVHEDVPDEDAEDIDRGWDDYYLGPIKKLLEN